jgi:hypothetical protein
LSELFGKIGTIEISAKIQKFKTKKNIKMEEVAEGNKKLGPVKLFYR